MAHPKRRQSKTRRDKRRTHEEVMLVADFPGEQGWGYDGVGQYAVHAAYGGPEGFVAFIDACHARGLGVILDVVHNH